MTCIRMGIGGVLLVLFPAVSPAVADELRLRVELPAPGITMTPLGALVRVQDTVPGGAPGAPLLPEKQLVFLLPWGRRVEDVRLEDARTREVPGTYFVAPAQRPMPLTGRRPPEITPPDPASYRDDAPLPGKWVSLRSVQHKHGHALALIAVHPVSYRPASGRLTRLASATVVVTTRPGGRAPAHLRAEPRDRREIQRLCDDCTALGTYPDAPERAGSILEPGYFPYLIVAPDELCGIEGPHSLEALRDFRAASGLPARIVTLAWIREHYEGNRPGGGQDDATRVREFLADAHDEWAATWVLLVGDDDAADVGGESGDSLLPARGLYCHLQGYEPDRIPADLYYACLDGDFDHDRDGVYGEPGDGPDGGEVDLLAELYVGRAPADGPEEVSRFVAKVLAYESGTGEWLRDVWFFGEYLWNDPWWGPVWGGTSMDELIHGSQAAGITTLGFSSFPFFRVQTLYDRDLGEPGAWGAGEALDILDAGPHIVNHLGHSYNLGHLHLGSSQVDRLSNGNPFVIYSQGCHAGAFDNRAPADSEGFVYDQDCIGEHYLLAEHGAVAAMLNSRYGVCSPYGTDGPSHRFHREFWDAFFAEGAVTIGEAFADSKDDNAFGFGCCGIRWAGYSINLLGDPALRLKKSLETNQPVLGVYPPEIAIHHISQDDAPAPVRLRLRNEGGGALGFAVSTGASWLAPVPAEGTAPATVDLVVDPADLEPGAHEANVTVTAEGALESPRTVPVAFQVIEVPRLRVPHVVQAPVLDGDIAEGEYEQALPVQLAGQEGAVSAYLQVTEDVLYLAVEDFADTSRGGYDHLRLSFDWNLDGAWPAVPGVEGYLYLYAGGGGFPKLVPVSNPGGGLIEHQENEIVYPPGVAGAADLIDGHRVYELAIDLADPAVGGGPGATIGMRLLSVDAVDLAEHTVTGSFPRVVPDPCNQRAFARLDTAPPGPRLQVSPERIEVEALQGAQASSVGPVQVSVTNPEGDAISFSAHAPAEWLCCSPATGQTPATVKLEVDLPSPLEPGTRQGTLVVESADAWNSPLEVPFVLQVGPPPARLQVDAEGFRLAAVAGGDNPSGTFQVTNTGGRDLAFSIAAARPWLQAEPAQGLLPPGRQVVIGWRIMIHWVPEGHHASELVVSAPGAAGGPVPIPFGLEVCPPRPVPPVESLSIAPDGDGLFLAWSWPDDPMAARVRVTRAEGVCPQHPCLGDLVWEGVAESMLDGGVEAGTRYCYSVFTSDWTGRYSAPVSACAVPGPNHPPPAPEPLSPVDGARVPGVPALVAAAVCDPEGDTVSCRFELLPASGDEPLATGEGMLEAGRVVWYPPVDLAEGDTRRWRVTATDARGAESSPSIARTFTIETPEDPVEEDDIETQSGGCACGNRRSNRPGIWLIALLLSLVSPWLRRRDP